MRAWDHTSLSVECHNGRFIGQPKTSRKGTVLPVNISWALLGRLNSRQLGKRILQKRHRSRHLRRRIRRSFQLRRDRDRFLQSVPRFGRIIRHLAHRIETPEQFHANLSRPMMRINDALEQPLVPDQRAQHTFGVDGIRRDLESRLSGVEVP